jgi:hypothetical protein
MSRIRRCTCISPSIISRRALTSGRENLFKSGCVCKPRGTWRRWATANRCRPYPLTSALHGHEGTLTQLVSFHAAHRILNCTWRVFYKTLPTVCWSRIPNTNRRIACCCSTLLRTLAPSAQWTVTIIQAPIVQVIQWSPETDWNSIWKAACIFPHRTFPQIWIPLVEK